MTLSVIGGRAGRSKTSDGPNGTLADLSSLRMALRKRTEDRCCWIMWSAVVYMFQEDVLLTHLQTPNGRLRWNRNSTG